MDWNGVEWRGIGLQAHHACLCMHGVDCMNQISPSICPNTIVGHGMAVGVEDVLFIDEMYAYVYMYIYACLHTYRIPDTPKRPIVDGDIRVWSRVGREEGEGWERERERERARDIDGEGIGEGERAGRA